MGKATVKFSGNNTLLSYSYPGRVEAETFQGTNIIALHFGATETHYYSVQNIDEIVIDNGTTKD